MTTHEDYENGLFRDMHGNRVKLGKAARAEVIGAYEAFKDMYGAATTKANHAEMNQRGKVLVDTQAKHGVWLIHPVNARHGLRADDPRLT